MHRLDAVSIARWGFTARSVKLGLDLFAQRPAIGAWPEHGPAPTTAMLCPVDCRAEPLPLERRECRKHLAGEPQSVELLERSSRVLNRVERGEVIPDVLVCVHDGERSDPRLGRSFVKPRPYVRGLERVVPGKLLRLPEDVFQRPGAVSSGLHCPPDLGVLVREPLQSKTLRTELSGGGGVFSFLRRRERQTAPGDIPEAERRAPELQRLNAIPERRQEQEYPADRHKCGAPSPVFGKEHCKEPRHEHRDADQRRTSSHELSESHVASLLDRGSEYIESLRTQGTPPAVRRPGMRQRVAARVSCA